MSTQRAKPTWIRPLPLLVAGLLAATSVASAQNDGRAVRPVMLPTALPTPEELDHIVVDSALRRLVEQLDAPAYHQREAAMDELRSRSLDVDQLCALLGEGTLSNEQRYRLLAILREQLINAPRGALGISMTAVRDLPATPGAKEVTELVPNLPAIEVLRVGDRITHIDGRPLERDMDLPILVQSKRPGEEISLFVQRPQRDETGHFIRDAEDRIVYERLEIAFELGSLEALRDESDATRTIPAVIERQRRWEARLAETRWKPRPVMLRVAGEMNPDDQERSLPRLSGIDVFSAHTQIRILLREFRWADEGRIEDDDAQRAQWRAIIDRLEELLDHPDLGRDERDHLRRRLAEVEAAFPE